MGTTYANAKWKAPFCTAEPSEDWMSVTMRIYDFYLMRGNKIWYNWMLIDVVDLMLQAGHQVLPKSPLREGFVHLPAAISRYTKMEDAEIAKEIVSEVLHYDFTSNDTDSSCAKAWIDDMTWYGPVGFGMATNKEEYEQYFIKPMRSAFSNREIEINVLTCEGTYCGANGWLYGKHTGNFLENLLPTKMSE